MNNSQHKLPIILIAIILLTALITWASIERIWAFAIPSVFILGYYICQLFLLFKQHAKKIAFMFDAISNNDYSFKYSTIGHSKNDKLVLESLNRIAQILRQTKEETIQREKYYELIMSQVDTGIIVIDKKGSIYQTNKKALHLLGISILTHATQLARIDPALEELMLHAQPGEKYQISYNNEREQIHLSIRTSEIVLKDKRMRILAINDINNELDDKEIESWIRLTRVLTHEIMNSITPITSLSDTLLSLHSTTDKEIRDGLEIIRSTGKGLIAFIDSYRKFTHIQTPQPALFDLRPFIERMVQLAKYQNEYPNIQIHIEVEPDDLILYADENLITQVMLNLLKNAMQAIGCDQQDGEIIIKGYCDPHEAVIIEVTNNGPSIPPEEIDHIFVPFFTTKERGSGIGLSLSRQIMRLSGGTIALRNMPSLRQTTFVLTFP